MLVGASLFAASALLCIVGYLALSVPGGWFGSLPTLRWTAAELAVTQGSGQPTVDGLRVSAPGEQGIAIVSIQTSFRSAGYAAVTGHRRCPRQRCRGADLAQRPSGAPFPHR
jgi:hypothetical protein